MPRFIVKLTEADKEYFLEWSTVVDAPVTLGMTLKEFKAYYKDQYGKEGMSDLKDRLKRVEEFDTSSIHGTSIDELIKINRAGLNETELSRQQIIDHFCKHPVFKSDEEADQYCKNPPIGKLPKPL